MNIDNLLYHVEDIMVESEVQKCLTLNELIQWAELNNYTQHHAVNKKLEEFRTEYNGEEDSSDESLSLDLYAESWESDDDLCVTSAHHNPHQPVFLSRKEKERLCELIDIPLCEETDFDQIHSTLEDGNCLFRAVSHAISDSEENHQILRMKTIKHAQKNSEKFRVILKEGYSSVNEYIKNTKMDITGTWTTEFEIFALFHLLSCDIYTRINENCQWLKFSGNVIGQDKSLITGNILLQHQHERHYNVYKKF